MNIADITKCKDYSNPSLRLVLLDLMLNADDNGNVTTSIRDIANSTLIGERATRTSLDKLQEGGWISVSKNRKGSVITINGYAKRNSEVITTDKASCSHEQITKVSCTDIKPVIAEKKEKRFVPPTVEEVDSYCQSKGYTDIDAEMFVAFYESKGWKIGKNTMKSWTAAITTWRKRNKEDNKTNIYKNNGIRTVTGSAAIYASQQAAAQLAHEHSIKAEDAVSSFDADKRKREIEASLGLLGKAW